LRPNVSRYHYAGISDEVPWFNCSAGFIDDFKKRNRMSSWSVDYKRCPTVDPIQ
jgi:hypothetical protein